MSKMFSVVTLDAPHSLMTEHFVPGSPDGLDELLDCDEISEVLAEWPLGGYHRSENSDLSLWRWRNRAG